MNKEKIIFIVRRGIIREGLVGAIIFSVLMSCFSPLLLEFHFPSLNDFFRYLIVSIPIFSIAGALQAIRWYKIYQREGVLPKPNFKSGLLFLLIFVAVMAVLLWLLR